VIAILDIASPVVTTSAACQTVSLAFGGSPP